MDVYGFTELAECLQEAGYPQDWVDDRLIENIPMYAHQFFIRGLMPWKDDQLFVAMDFNFSTGRIVLEHFSGHLLKLPATEEHIQELNTPVIRDRWIAESTTFNDLVPAWFLFDTLAACRQMSIDNPDLVNKTTNTMNLNNLADLKEEAKALGFSPKTIQQMEENMKNNLPYFILSERVAADKGDMIVAPHFKQSSQSDYYYLNRFDVAQSVVKPLEEGQKYLVISGEKDKEGKYPVAKFDSVEQAIANFNKRETSAELAVGKDAAHKTKLAGMEEGKVNYVAPDFKRALFNPPVAQTFWVDRGKGFTAEQAVNLMQGRAVYRDDLLANGTPYKAWVMLDTDKPRDRNNNLLTRQFHDPSYGFDLNKALGDYKIKEMENPEKAEKLEAAIRNGNRPVATVEKDGKEMKVQITAAVRYGKLNFYDLDGKPEKREQFEKTPELAANIFDRKLERTQSQEQGMGIGR